MILFRLVEHFLLRINCTIVVHFEEKLPKNFRAAFWGGPMANFFLLFGIQSLAVSQDFIRNFDWNGSNSNTHFQ